jgi:predicted N-acetyltransferase YhbS
VITGRDILREEIKHVWNIDRSEVIENIYRLENGVLVLRPQHIDVPGWPPGEAEKYTPILLDSFDRGGWFHGLFDLAQRSTPAGIPSREQRVPQQRIWRAVIRAGQKDRSR